MSPTTVSKIAILSSCVLLSNCQLRRNSSATKTKKEVLQNTKIPKVFLGMCLPDLTSHYPQATYQHEVFRSKNVDMDSTFLQNRRNGGWLNRAIAKGIFEKRYDIRFSFTPGKKIETMGQKPIPYIMMLPRSQFGRTISHDTNFRKFYYMVKVKTDRNDRGSKIVFRARTIDKLNLPHTALTFEYNEDMSTYSNDNIKETYNEFFKDQRYEDCESFKLPSYVQSISTTRGLNKVRQAARHLKVNPDDKYNFEQSFIEIPEGVGMYHDSMDITQLGESAIYVNHPNIDREMVLFLEVDPELFEDTMRFVNSVLKRPSPRQQMGRKKGYRKTAKKILERLRKEYEVDGLLNRHSVRAVTALNNIISGKDHKIASNDLHNIMESVAKAFGKEVEHDEINNLYKEYELEADDQMFIDSHYQFGESDL